MIGYAYLDLNHTPVLWALMRGELISSEYLASQQRGFLSYMQAGMLYHNNSTRLYNESIIEYIRKKNFPKCVSRLKGMYFFDKNLQHEDINDWGAYFKHENKMEFRISDSNKTKCDSQWITFAPIKPDGKLNLDRLDWISNYWNGEKYNANPVWEYLISGKAKLVDNSLKLKFLDEVKIIFPNSEPTILMSYIAGDLGLLGGVISPYLLKKDQHQLRLVYILQNEDFMFKPFINKIKEHPYAQQLYDSMLKNESWEIPNLSNYERVFALPEIVYIFDENIKLSSIHT